MTTVSLGRQVLQTPGVTSDISVCYVMECLKRHHSGDWGDLCDEDKTANAQCHREGWGRLHSSYNTPDGKLWIITDGLSDITQRYTTILLPSEY